MIVDSAVYRGGERLDTSHGGACAAADLAALRRDAGDDDFVWVGLHDPTHEELDAAAEAFGLHPLAVEDALNAHQRPKLERYDDTLFLVLKPARYDDAAEAVDLGEIHVFVGPGFAITVRHGEIGSLDEVSSRLTRHPDLCALGPSAVLHAVADQVVDAYRPVIRGLERDITEIERAVFNVEEHPPTERIYSLMREVIDFHRATASLLAPLEELAKGRVSVVPEDLAPHFRDVADHARQATEASDSFRQLLNGALQANVALIGLQENRDQRKMSAWAAIALVPTILAGIWGMNFDRMPLLHTAWGYPLALGIMGGIAGYLYWRLRRNGWM